MIKDYAAALAWLYEQKKSHKREDLSRIKECIKLLNIKTNYPIIHIAGTNGKGSTASFLHQMLFLRGKKVGLFVSPYVISFNERIEINGAYITDEEVLSYTRRLEEFSKLYQQNYQDTIPFFELTFLMALLYFEKQNIEILVLECGLGGRLDVTNALEKKVAVITNIGYDHMVQLGNTLEEIATHKLGITRAGIPCFTAVDEGLIPYFSTYGKKNKVDMNFIKPSVSNVFMDKEGTHFTYNGRDFKTSLKGLYQAYNASLAIAVMEYLEHDFPKELIQLALDKTTWPGRFEFVKENILIDGAHNIDGIRALCESLKISYPNYRIKIVFTALKDKASKQMLEILDSVADEYFFTTILDKRAGSASDFTNYTVRPFEVIEDYQEAIHKAVLYLGKDELLVITGSLHFISEARKTLFEVFYK
ncbi:MAG: bifunctional folylpolyglutamate synthase/dihydrofolate synthase [Anaeroplasmataceae bacterium]|nr:bifunctional folylpolyglutamate synthase/dihydrofolate synthase [Anaeroplasmataceae bacterium]MDE6413782.1 bifunctional folylpolyglutamate synthase/dihydrofolate synthase [Anaeroplasmataceae bacterium]